MVSPGGGTAPGVLAVEVRFCPLPLWADLRTPASRPAAVSLMAPLPDAAARSSLVNPALWGTLPDDLPEPDGPLPLPAGSPQSCPVKLLSLEDDVL